MQTYSEKLKDPRWQKVRLKVMERDEFKCRDCGAETKTLQVHHCAYSGEPWDIHKSFLLTLCDSCHAERGRIEKEAKSLFGSALARAGTDQIKEWIFVLGLFGPSAMRNLEEAELGARKK
jgi:hypothetical protein